MKNLKIIALVLSLTNLLSAQASESDFILRDWVDSPLNDCILSKASEVTAREGHEFLSFVEFEAEFENGRVTRVRADFLTRHVPSSRIGAFSLSIGTLDRWYPVIEENNTRLGYGTKSPDPRASLRNFAEETELAAVDLSGCMAPQSL